MKIKIYTDGSCLENPGDGGWAAIIIFGQQKKIISNRSTFFCNICQI